MVRITAETLNAVPRRPACGQQTGLVSLVGAGPGNPDLLTSAALDRIAHADVVLHDALIPFRLLALVPQTARLIPTGKRAGHGGCDQRVIEELMVSEARAGRRVVRLKGGDPFLFGRGGEETSYLDAAQIRFEVIPGVSAAFGAAASFGIPLTRRGTVRGVRFLTASTCPRPKNSESATGRSSPGDGGLPDIQWREDESLVLYMVGHKLGETARSLLAGGCPPATPVALIERATWSDARCRWMTCAQLADEFSTRGVRTPALLIVAPAEVRAATEGISAEETRSDRSPAGRTCCEQEHVALIGILQDCRWWTPNLEARGLIVHELPIARAVARPEPINLAAMIEAGGARFTDPHTVEPFFRALEASGRDLRSLGGLCLEAEDAVTREALRSYGVLSDSPERRGIARAGLPDHLTPPMAEYPRLLGPGGDPGPRDLVVYDLEPMPIAPAAAAEELALCGRCIFSSPSMTPRLDRLFTRERSFHA